MKEKIKLPDALLDAISGGVLLLDGERVKDINLYVDGMLVFTEKGDEIFMGWAPADQAAIDRDPEGVLDLLDHALLKMHKSGGEHEMTFLFNISKV